MTSKRNKMMLVYFVSMAGLALLNILFNVVPNRLSDNMVDIVFTLCSQVVCMGIIPLVGGYIINRDKEQPCFVSVKQLAKRWHYCAPRNKKVWLAVVPLAISFYFLTQLTARISVLLLMILQFNFPISPGTIYSGPGSLVLWIFMGAAMPAIFEELTHRGFVLDALSDRGSEVEAVMLCGLLFACMHTNIMQFFYAFVGGCIMAWLVVKTGSIFPSMLLHFVNNAFSHIQSYAAQYPNGALGWIDTIERFFAENSIGLLLSIILLIANVVVFLFLLSWVQKLSGKPIGIKERSIVWRSKGPDGKKEILRIGADAYCPSGNATLSDNVMLYATIAMTICSTLFTYIWGVLR